MPASHSLSLLCVIKQSLLCALIYLLSVAIPAQSAEPKKKESALQQITDIGFEKAGSWQIQQNNLDYTLEKYSKTHNILYAFVADNKIKYIGKTTGTFKRRMNQYKNPGSTQSTNQHSHDHILKLLAQNIAVDIYIFVDKKPLKHEGFDINLAAGLEDSLIATLSPPWNRRK